MDEEAFWWWVLGVLGGFWLILIMVKFRFLRLFIGLTFFIFSFDVLSLGFGRICDCIRG